jgi:tetratricopeptide (TPR) repeat protein
MGRHSRIASLLDAAISHLQAGELDQAAVCYQRVLRLNPNDIAARFGLGNALAGLGELERATACYRQVLAIQHECPEAWSNLGNALREQRRYEEAIRCLETALRQRPDFADAWVNLGAALEAQDRLEEAAACLTRALELSPSHPHAHSNLAGVLARRGQLDQAIAQVQRALELAPGLPEALNNLGAILERAGRLEDAVACYQAAIRARPGFADAHVNLGMAWLLEGRFEQGWQEYEWRLKGSGLTGLSRPLWDGAALEGRTILLRAEQGLGDTIHFVRYGTLLKQRGATVLVECPERLVPLLGTVPGVDAVFAQGDALPAFDVYAPLMSLPRILGTRLETIPNQVPYLGVPPEVAAAWGARINAATPPRHRRIGLVWASNRISKNVRDRSLPLAALAPLAEAPGWAWFSLQRGPAAAEAVSPPAGWSLANLEDESGQITDTAAAMLNLDLIITVDTLAAHLAGALSRPVWVLLPFAPDFRWMRGRAASPWYPTMRLFRQLQPGDWPAVAQEVLAALQMLIGSGGRPAS